MFDILGQRISEKQTANNQPFDIPLNVAMLANGIYIVRVIANNGNANAFELLKLIKTN